MSFQIDDEIDGSPNESQSHYLSLVGSITNLSLCSATCAYDLPMTNYKKSQAAELLHVCNWCGTKSSDTDSRGNCIACGHPF
jgi:hypothetical protein